MLRAAYFPLWEEERQELERERQADRERTFLSWTAQVKDPRQAGKVLYPLDEILLVALCSILCAEEGTCEAMHGFGIDYLDELRKILPFKNGIPCADTYWRVLSVLDAKQFATVLAHWQQTVSKAVGDDGLETLAIDGKTIGGILDKAGGKSAIHLLSAYATQARVLIAQRPVEGKTNEHKQIPHVLKTLALKGTTVTIDAAGCYHDVVKEIRRQKADYVIALKGNQGSWRDLAREGRLSPARVRQTRGGGQGTWACAAAFLHQQPPAGCGAAFARGAGTLGGREYALDIGHDVWGGPVHGSPTNGGPQLIQRAQDGDESSAAIQTAASQGKPQGSQAASGLGRQAVGEHVTGRVKATREKE